MPTRFFQPETADMINQLTTSSTNSEVLMKRWLPDMDLNHDKQIQRLLCYHYTIGQAGSGREVSQVKI